MEEDTESTKIMGEEFDNALSEELYESENSEQKLTENENNEDCLLYTSDAADE